MTIFSHSVVTVTECAFHPMKSMVKRMYGPSTNYQLPTNQLPPTRLDTQSGNMVHYHAKRESR